LLAAATGPAGPPHRTRAAPPGTERPAPGPRPWRSIRT